jgi:hypothetical protein
MRVREYAFEPTGGGKAEGGADRVQRRSALEEHRIVRFSTQGEQHALRGATGGELHRHSHLQLVVARVRDAARERTERVLPPPPKPGRTQHTTRPHAHLVRLPPPHRKRRGEADGVSVCGGSSQVHRFAPRVKVCSHLDAPQLDLGAQHGGEGAESE